MGFANTVSKITEMILGGSSVEDEDSTEVVAGGSAVGPKLVSKTIDLPPLRAEDTVEGLSERLSSLLNEDQQRHDTRVEQLKAKVSSGEYEPETEDLAKAILSYPDDE